MQNVPGSTTNLGQSQLDSPDLALVAQAILADELQLSVPSPTLTRVPDVSGARSRSVAVGEYVQTSRLKRTTGDAVRLRVAAGRDGGGRWRRREVREKLKFEKCVCLGARLAGQARSRLARTLKHSRLLRIRDSHQHISKADTPNHNRHGSLCRSPR